MSECNGWPTDMHPAALHHIAERLSHPRLVQPTAAMYGEHTAQSKERPVHRPSKAHIVRTPAAPVAVRIQQWGGRQQCGNYVRVIECRRVVAECEQCGVGRAVGNECVEAGQVVGVKSVEALVEGTEAVDECEDGGAEEESERRAGVAPVVRRGRWR